MKIACPQCSAATFIRTSRPVTTSTREAYVHCCNPECACVFHVLISVDNIVAPPINCVQLELALPRPEAA